MRTEKMNFAGRVVSMLVTETLFERMKGLLGRSGLSGEEAMLFKKCSAIHTIGMKFTIDVYFTDAEMNIVKIVRGVRPGNPFVFGGFRAKNTVEMQSND